MTHKPGTLVSFRELLVEFEEFCDALAFGHGLDGEAFILLLCDG